LQAVWPAIIKQSITSRDQLVSLQEKMAVNTGNYPPSTTAGKMVKYPPRAI